MLFQMIKKSWQKNADKKRVENREPLDKNLPFDLHIDGKISLDPAAMILPGDLHLQVTDKVHFVKGFGVGTFFKRNVTRIFLEGEKEVKPSYLQIVHKSHSSNSEVEHVRWFQPLPEVFPTSKDEWEFWLSPENGMIGYPKFQLQDGTILPRVWDPGDHQISPVSITETVLTDRYEPNYERIKHKCMLYSRELKLDIGPVNEYALVAEVTVPSGAYVAIDVGIDINPQVDMEVHY